MGDIDTAAVDSLKTLDPKRPIREATEQRMQFYVGSVPKADIYRAIARSFTSVEEDQSFRHSGLT